MSDPAVIDVAWPGAVRIIRSRFPPIDLFEDIADPRDWPLIIAAEMKTNPRLAQSVGSLDLVPPDRRVSGQGASYLMAPFTHVSTDRPTQFSDGSFGVLYAGDSFEVALAETIFHHGRFMAATNEPAGWTSQFRELVLTVDARLHDLRGSPSTRRAMRKRRPSEPGCALRPRMAWSTRASAGREENASAFLSRSRPRSCPRAARRLSLGRKAGGSLPGPGLAEGNSEVFRIFDG